MKIRFSFLGFLGLTGLLGALICLFLVLLPLANWLVFEAYWIGLEPSACQNAQGLKTGGACWPVVWDNLSLLAFGRYPLEEVWRSAASGIAAAGLLWWIATDRSTRFALKALIVCLVLAGILALMAGLPALGMVKVETSRWGGLSLTLILSLFALLLGFPLGIAAALGRTSSLPVLRWLCGAIVETVRGVPLITLLFLGQYLLPLFLPATLSHIDELARAGTVLVIFESVYIAEVLRGGLQAIPRGQWQAAQALGLGTWRTLRLVVLPQVFNITRPSLVGTFIGLLKDTSLVAIIGIYDLLGIARNISSNPKWIGFDLEPLVAAGFVYWLLCTGLSLLGRRLGTLTSEHLSEHA